MYDQNWPYIYFYCEKNSLFLNASQTLIISKAPDMQAGFLKQTNHPNHITD